MSVEIHGGLSEHALRSSVFMQVLSNVMIESGQESAEECVIAQANGTESIVERGRWGWR